MVSKQEEDGIKDSPVDSNMRPGWEPWIYKNKNTNSKKLNLVKVFSKEEKNGIGQGRNWKLRTTLKNNTFANITLLLQEW